MSLARLCFAAASWFLCIGLAFAQPAKTEPPKGERPLVEKIDAASLPAGARLRLGKMGGFRYTKSFATATMSLDGTLLAVATINGDSIQIVEVATGKTVQQLQGRILGGISHMTFSADGQMFAVGSFGQDLRVWDVKTGKQVQQFQHRDPGASRQYGASFSRDGKVLGAGSEIFGPNNNQGQVKAWNVATGKLIGPLETLHNYGIRVQVAPDGKTMASWGQYLQRGGMANNNRDAPRTIQVWDLATSKELRQIKVDFGPQGFGSIQTAAFTPDGKTLIVASGQSTFHMIDFETGKEWRRFAGQRSQSGSMLRVSPDGELLAVFDMAGIIQAWEIKSGKRLDLVDGPRSQYLAVGFPGKNRILVLASQAQSLHWWEATAQEKVPPFQGHLTAIAALAFTPDGKSIITAGNDQRLMWWNAKTGAEERTLRLMDDDMRFGFGGVTQSFALAPDARFAATLSNAGNGSIRLWNLKSGRAVCDFEGPRAYNQVGIAFSPDSSKLASSGSQSPMHIWDITTGQELPKMPNNNPNPNDFGNSRVAFSPDGKIVAVHLNQYDRLTGLPISDLIVWNTVQGKEMYREKIPLPNNSGGAGGMAFSPDSKYLAICEGAGSILVLNASSGREWRRLHSSQRNSSFQIAFSADRRFIAIGSSPRNFGVFPGQAADETVLEIWEVAGGLLRQRLQGHSGAITCLAFSPDGATLASGSQDMTVILWDFTGKSGARLMPYTDDEYQTAWTTLSTNDRQVAEVVRRMITSPEPTLAFLKKHFQPSKEEALAEQVLNKMVRDLDSRNYEIREKAMRDLQRLGARAEAVLKQALAGSPSVEVRRRISDLLAKMERVSYTPEELQALRGVEVLERIGTDEARAWLTALAAGAPSALATQEAQAALRRLR